MLLFCRIRYHGFFTKIRLFTENIPLFYLKWGIILLDGAFFTWLIKPKYKHD